MAAHHMLKACGRQHVSVAVVEGARRDRRIAGLSRGRTTAASKSASAEPSGHLCARSLFAGRQGLHREATTAPHASKFVLHVPGQPPAGRSQCRGCFLPTGRQPTMCAW